MSERDAVDPAVGVLVPADGVVDDEAGVDGGEGVPDRSGQAAAEPSGKVGGCCSGGCAVVGEPGVPGAEQRPVVGEQVAHCVPRADVRIGCAVVEASWEPVGEPRGGCGFGVDERHSSFVTRR